MSQGLWKVADVFAIMDVALSTTLEALLDAVRPTSAFYFHPFCLLAFI